MCKTLKSIAIVLLIGVFLVIIAFVGGVLTFDSQPDWAVDGHANANQPNGYRGNQL